ncbi:unnamed protein product [Caenorhabditis angaria]|uniref:Protein kinase domain-containing protein n=1 Tax=Caenorhabditis angaria TaxID=860376 RepID=A0A9P1IA91_9PELO|nr:unnamed protein product [Caenorhabditis angaria]
MPTRGSFGTVIKGKLMKLKIDVAIKRIHEKATEANISEAWDEVRKMRTFDHQNVIRIYGVIIDSLPIMIVMEYVESVDEAKPPKRISCVFCGWITVWITLSGHELNFGSIRLLIDSFVANKTPVIDNLFLIRQIPRKSWELSKDDIVFPQEQ